MYLSFAIIFGFFVIGALFLTGLLFFRELLSPTLTKDYAKKTRKISESQFNSHFYIIVSVFVIIDVAIILLFPFAIIFRRVGTLALIGLSVFTGIVLIGLLYIWFSGNLIQRSKNSDCQRF